MKVAAVHQPNYIPWLGYFDKVAKADVFVILDDVQFSKGDYTNRNQIKMPQGAHYLTIPCSAGGMLIKDIPLDAGDWVGEHLKTIQRSYSRTPHYGEYAGELESLYRREFKKLVDFNLRLLTWLFEKFQIKTEVVLSSDLGTSTSSSQKLADICLKVGADTYLSGEGGKEYVDADVFKKAGVGLIYQKFTHPVYRQCFGDFIPNLSALDYLFNVGADGDIFKN